MISMLLQGKTKPIYHPAGKVYSQYITLCVHPNVFTQLIWVIMWLLLTQKMLCTRETNGKTSSSGTILGKKSTL